MNWLTADLQHSTFSGDTGPAEAGLCGAVVSIAVVTRCYFRRLLARQLKTRVSPTTSQRKTNKQPAKARFVLFRVGAALLSRSHGVTSESRPADFTGTPPRSRCGPDFPQHAEPTTTSSHRASSQCQLEKHADNTHKQKPQQILILKKIRNSTEKSDS